MQRDYWFRGCAATSKGATSLRRAGTYIHTHTHVHIHIHAYECAPHVDPTAALRAKCQTPLTRRGGRADALRCVTETRRDRSEITRHSRGCRERARAFNPRGRLTLSPRVKEPSALAPSSLRQVERNNPHPSSWSAALQDWGYARLGGGGQRREGWRGPPQSPEVRPPGWKRMPRTRPLTERKIPLTGRTVTRSLARSIGIQTRCSKNNGARQAERERTEGEQRGRKGGRERHVYLLMVPFSCSERKSTSKQPNDHPSF